MKESERDKLRAKVTAAIQRIVRGYQPERIVLFGSFARGDFHEDSDVDLLIVKDTTESPLRRMDAVLDHCEGDIAVEALIYTPAELEAMLRRGSSFLEQALAEGRIVYERSKP
jgi:predicted nucleotidyltransferase